MKTKETLMKKTVMILLVVVAFLAGPDNFAACKYCDFEANNVCRDVPFSGVFGGYPFATTACEIREWNLDIGYIRQCVMVGRPCTFWDIIWD